MIWLTWRQFRAGALTMAAVLATLALALTITGHELASDYSSAMAACTPNGDCAGFLDTLFDDYRNPFLLVTAIALLLPALIGLFWGAPLIARELEAGTHRLVWNQSVTRGHWLAVKLLVIGLAAAVAAGVGTLAISWWAGPVDKAAAGDYPKMEALLFPARGIVPIGYALFAFALGVAVGMVIRRTVPAMAVTLAIFAAAQTMMPMLVRPHLQPPVETTKAFTAADIDGVMMAESGERRVIPQAQTPEPGGWLLSDRTLNSAGEGVTEMVLPAATAKLCRDNPREPIQGIECIATKLNDLGYRLELTYQPASRFWRFQWAETGIYLSMSLGLAGFCLWWVRRRLT